MFYAGSIDPSDMCTESPECQRHCVDASTCRTSCCLLSGRKRPSSRRTRTSPRPKRRSGDVLLYILLFAIIFEEATLAYAGRDYYDILGVARDADGPSIKRAFRKLAREHHPDKNQGDKTSEKLYVELNQAYEVLSDEGKRQQYDMYGEEGLKQGMQGGGDDDDWGGFGDLFGFGGGKRRRRQQQEQERTSPDLVVPVSVSLETLYNGGIVEISQKRRVLCSSWSDCESKCSHCGGSGIVITTRRLGPGFVQQMQSPCPKCSGTGKISTKNCKSCPEGQFEQVEKDHMIDIERGYPEGYRIPFEGMSDEIPDHVAGTVFYEIDTIPHATFRRKGNDLHYDLSVTLTEALVGIDRAVKQLDGRIVPIRTSKVVVPNEKLLIAGEGMPVAEDGSTGNMIVHIWVDFPEFLSDEQKEAVIKVHGKAPATEIGNGGGPHKAKGTAGDATKGGKDGKDEL